MITPRPIPARCMCGWSGMLVRRADCPQCQRDYTHRITGPREEALRALARGEQPVMWAITRNWLLWNGLIVPITEKIPPSPVRHVRGKRRHYALTVLGQQAISTGPAESGTAHSHRRCSRGIAST